MIIYKDENGTDIKEFSRLLIKKNNVIYFNNALVRNKNGRPYIEEFSLKDYMNGEYTVLVINPTKEDEEKREKVMSNIKAYLNEVQRLYDEKKDSGTKFKDSK